MSENNHLPLAILAFFLGVGNLGASLIITPNSHPAENSPSIVAAPAVPTAPAAPQSPNADGTGSYLVGTSNTESIRIPSITRIEQKVVATPQPVSQLLPNLAPEGAPAAPQAAAPAPSAGITMTPEPGMAPFPIAADQQYLIESATYLKDVTPFKQGSGPNTTNRMDEWLSTDRSITNYNSARAYAVIHLSDYGWGIEEWAALDRLWWHESNWSPIRTDGDTSKAWGIPQALPADKMAPFGNDYLTNPQTQIRFGLEYIKQRYGSPTAAWNFWKSQAETNGEGWY